jgi:hypothetical protein
MKSDTLYLVHQGKVGLVAGWGKTDNSFGKTGTNVLNKVLVPVINNDECIRWHEDKNIMVQVSLHSSALYTHLSLLCRLLSLHCNENLIYGFLEKELRGLSPDSCIRVSVSDLYLSTYLAEQK